MWPKVLLELLPHLARLVPMADKYLTSRTGAEGAQEAALAAMVVDVRNDLGAMAETHAGIYRRLEEQSAQVAGVAAEVAKARSGVGAMEARVAELERTAQRAMRLLVWLVAVVALLVGTLILLAVMLTAK